ncbi:MAG: hypothetical protein IJ192_06835 [Clostridia bacterium]|nr:hypothetical protein [Clostridia bacterium]
MAEEIGSVEMLRNDFIRILFPRITAGSESLTYKELNQAANYGAMAYCRDGFSLTYF